MRSSISQQIWRPKTSVKLRFAISQGIFIAIIISFLALLLYFTVRQRLVGIKEDSYKILARTLSSSVYDSYINKTPEEKRQGIITAVHRVDVQEGVKYILIVDANNKVYYDTVSGAKSLENKTFAPDDLTNQSSKGNVVVGLAEREGTSYYNYVAPFISNNQVLYSVRIGIDRDVVDGEFNRLAQLFLYLGGFGIGVGVIATYILAARMTRPIIQLTESALAIRAGNLNAYPNISTNDELEQLSREFQGMVEKLKSFYFQEFNLKKKALEDKERLADINQRLKDLDRQKTDFLNAASHQLRTPLSVIHWSLSIIVESIAKLNLSPDQQELLQESLKSTKRMIDLVNDLLDISRIEQGRKQLAWAKGNFGTVCEQLVAALKPLAQNKNMELTYEKKSEIPDSYLDEKSFYQVVNNFVDNAIKYTAQGYVHVSAEKKNDKVEIRISDSGIGMTEQERTDLFTRFSRGADAEKMFPNGSGLGMYVARTILLQHGGEIGVESEKGKGTTFILSVPLYNEIPAHPPVVADPSSQQMGGLPVKA